MIIGTIYLGDIMKIRSTLLGAMASLSLVALGSSSASATTALSGSLNAVANASINNGAIATNQQSVSWTGTPTSLSTSVSATQTNGSDYVTTSGSAVANWNSADSGSVAFTNYGWAFSLSSGSGASDLTQGRGGDDWTYTFTASQNGQIKLNYNYTLASGNGFGLWGWGVDFSAGGTGAPNLDPFNPTLSGVFTGTLVSGQTYTIGLVGNPNITGAGGNYSGYVNGDVTWSITGVPETSTWVMMLAGFAGLGFVGYRRNKAATLAA
jgi:hypothetical protein